MKAMRMQLMGLAVTAAAAMGLASCSNDMEPNTPQNEGMVNVTMTTSLPQSLETYATNSALGGLKNLEGKGLTVRYIMEIYTKDSKTLVERKFAYKPLETNGGYVNASFETRLLASEYNFVFWADIVKKATSIAYGQILEGLDTSNFYANSYFFSNTDEESDVLYCPIDNNATIKGDLKTIFASKVGAPVSPVSSEMYDGYSCKETVDLRTEATTQSFVLKRPFAKLRIVTTDADKLKSSPDWAKTTAVVKQTTELPTVFNAVTGEAETREGITGYWELFTVKAESYSEETESQPDRTLGVFYFPKPAKIQDMTFAFNIYDASGNELAEDVRLSVGNVPLVANKLTTIKGNILSKNATVTVTIKDELEEGDEVVYGKEADTPEALMNILNGKTEQIKYTGKVTKAEGLTLDFTTVDKYDEGNSSTLTLDIPDMEENAVITILGGDVMPKTIALNNSKKCSLRVNAEKTEIFLVGNQYGILLYNCSMLCEDNCTIDSFLYTDTEHANFFYPSNSDYDRIVLGADFSMTNATCKKHKTGCDLLNKINTWLTDNPGKTVWDFVGDSATM